MDIVNGSQLLIKHMPYPIATSLIYWVGGKGWDHCASVLWDAHTGQLMVYEAQPPRVRKMSVPDYIEQMRKWAAKYPRWRRRKNKPFVCEVYNPPGDLQLQEMWQEAESWLGAPYGMIFNWLFATDKIHCSEFQRRVLERDEKFKGAWTDEEPSRTEPVENRDVLISKGWPSYELDL